MTRLPLAPLLELTGMDPRGLALAVGANPGRVDVTVDLFTADRWAVALGLHPASVWQEWYGIVDYCARGHVWADNERVDPAGYRHCRACDRERQRKHRVSERVNR